MEIHVMKRRTAREIKAEADARAADAQATFDRLVAPAEIALTDAEHRLEDERANYRQARIAAFAARDAILYPPRKRTK